MIPYATEDALRELEKEAYMALPMGWILGRIGGFGYSQFARAWFTPEIVTRCPKCEEWMFVNEKNRVQVNGKELKHCYNCKEEIRYRK
jgi:hypothetical protein